jgi:hypothetical protein
MKVQTTIFFLLIFNFSFCQLEKIKGNWLSENNELISIKDTLKSENYITNSNLRTDNFYLHLNKETISFQSRYFYSGDLEKMYTDKYDLKILELNDSILIVKPSSEKSISYFQKSIPIKLIKQEFIKDPDFKFEKIIFHTSTCYGSCPEINLEIDSNRDIKISSAFFKSISEFEKDKNRSGNFIGKLDLKTYEELIKLIIQSKITTLNREDKNLCCDGAVKTIITYFNGKRSYVKEMFEPRVLGELISFLYSIDTKIELKRTSEIFKFEE